MTRKHRRLVLYHWNTLLHYCACRDCGCGLARGCSGSGRNGIGCDWGLVRGCSCGCVWVSAVWVCCCCVGEVCCSFRVVVCFFFKPKTAYYILCILFCSEMCRRYNCICGEDQTILNTRLPMIDKTNKKTKALRNNKWFDKGCWCVRLRKETVRQLMHVQRSPFSKNTRHTMTHAMIQPQWPSTEQTCTVVVLAHAV